MRSDWVFRPHGGDDFPLSAAAMHLLDRAKEDGDQDCGTTKAEASEY
jgi:hypothetical protein